MIHIWPGSWGYRLTDPQRELVGQNLLSWNDVAKVLRIVRWSKSTHSAKNPQPSVLHSPYMVFIVLDHRGSCWVNPQANTLLTTRGNSPWLWSGFLGARITGLQGTSEDDDLRDWPAFIPVMLAWIGPSGRRVPGGMLCWEEQSESVQMVDLLHEICYSHFDLRNGYFFSLTCFLTSEEASEMAQ